MKAKESLREWIKHEKNRYGNQYIRTSEVYAWGVENFSNRACRNAQDMAANGDLLERIPKAEALLLGFTGKEGVWRIK